jgi:hypothetical protein
MTLSVGELMFSLILVFTLLGFLIITPDLLIQSTPLKTLNQDPLRPFGEQTPGYFLLLDLQPLKYKDSVASSARVF